MLDKKLGAEAKVIIIYSQRILDIGTKAYRNITSWFDFFLFA